MGLRLAEPPTGHSQNLWNTPLRHKAPLSTAHGTFIKIDHSLGHKTSGVFKKIQAILKRYIAHFRIPLETKNRKDKKKGGGKADRIFLLFQFFETVSGYIGPASLKLWQYSCLILPKSCIAGMCHHAGQKSILH